MEHSPYVTWYEKTATQRPSFDSLGKSVSCDICIIGGAFTGLSAALYAAEQGKKVVLIEPSKIGFGCTGRTGGVVESGLNTTIDDLAYFHGHMNAHKFWESTVKARDAIVRNIEKYNIDCEFKAGLMELTQNGSRLTEYADYAKYYTHHFDGEFVDALNKSQIQNVVNAPKAKLGLQHMKSGVFNPLSYLFGLAKAAKEQGVEIYEGTAVKSVKDHEGVVVETENGNITCESVIVCGTAYMGEEKSPEKTRTVSIDYFQVVSEPVSDELVKSVCAEKIAMASREDMVSYIHFTEDNRLVYGGPQYGKVKNEEQEAVKKISFIEKFLPSLAGELKPAYFWSGPVGVPMSYVPVFEKQSSNRYLAHGFNGHGVAVTCYGGKVIVDAILGNDEMFDVYSRIQMVDMPTYAHHAIAKLSLFINRILQKPFSG